jgi:hypothetical protein
MSAPKLPALPADGSYIELTSYGETLPDVRVVHAADAGITLSLALAHVPPAGSPVTVRWAAATRGRYALTADVVSVDGNRVDIRFTGEPSIEQGRHYVRGGGGEPVVLVRPGHEEAVGRVHDLSERSMRAHFTDVEVHPGHEFELRVELGPDILALAATAAKVSSMRQQVPRRGPLSVEMVALLTDVPEHEARLIRRYVLRHQLLTRARGVTP